MPSPRSTRPSGSRGRRSSASVREDSGTATGLRGRPTGAAGVFVQVAHGRGGGIRTHGPSLPKRVRYQAALHPVAASLGARDGDRGGAAASRPGSPARPGHRTRSSPILSPARGRCGRPRCRRSRWPRARCSSRLLSSMLAGLPIVARRRCLPWGIGKRSRPADRYSRSVKTSPATHSRDAVATPGFPTAPGWATGPGVGRASATVEEASSAARA
jgi:hypothetical protein